MKQNVKNHMLKMDCFIIQIDLFALQSYRN